MSNLPFFVYTSKYDDEEDIKKEMLEKKRMTNITFNKEIRNKIELYNSHDLFQGETSRWILGNIDKIGSLNVFMFALTHLLIYNIFVDNDNDDTNVGKHFDIVEIMDEFHKPKYEKYIKYITNEQEIDKSIFIRSQLQISVYLKKIKMIAESSED